MESRRDRLLARPLGRMLTKDAFERIQNVINTTIAAVTVLVVQ